MCLQDEESQAFDMPGKGAECNTSVPQADEEALTRKRAAFVARRAGPPPAVAPLAWTAFLDLYELLDEFAVFLIEVPFLVRYQGISSRGCAGRLQGHQSVTVNVHGIPEAVNPITNHEDTIFESTDHLFHQGHDVKVRAKAAGGRLQSYPEH